MKVILLANKIRNALTEPFLLVIASFAALTVAPIFQAPFSNPYKISNPFNAYAFNPANNYTTIVFIIVATLSLFIIMRKLYGTKYAWLIKVVAICILLSNHFIFNMLNIATGYYHTDIIYANGPHSLDNFHSGEQLAPANAFLNGAKPYSDIFFLRGAGVDVIIPALGFLIFGKSVGSFLLISHILMLVTMLGFFLLLWLVIKGTFRYIGAITLFYISDALSLVQIRDIPVWAVMGLVIYYFSSAVNERYRNTILVTIGALASLELYIAIDYGMLLCVLALMLAVSLLLFGRDKKQLYTFTPKLWKTRAQYALYVLAGLIGGLAVPALFLGRHSFTVFLRMTFLDIPTFGGLLVSTEFPALFSPDYLIWGPVIIAIATGYLLIKLWAPTAPKDTNKLLPFTLIFLFTILTIKAGSNRIHILKMAQVVAPVYFAAFVILCLAIMTAYNVKAQRPQLLVPIAILLITLGIFAQLDPAKLLHQPRYTRADLSRYKHMPRTPDDYWIQPETKQVRDYIAADTTTQDHIFVFPANPAYYYLANRQNSTRFFISWYADPQPYTNQMLADLKKKPPKIVVYQENTWMDAPDGISMKDRLPEVSDWLLKTYPRQIKIGNTTLLQE